MAEKIFCEEQIKPELSEDTLIHYGVKGMKWRHRKAVRKFKHLLNKRKLNAQRLAEDIADGKKKVDDQTGKNKYLSGGTRTVGYDSRRNKYTTVNYNGNDTISFIKGKASNLDRALKNEMVRKGKATKVEKDDGLTKTVTYTMLGSDKYRKKKKK